MSKTLDSLVTRLEKPKKPSRSKKRLPGETMNEHLARLGDPVALRRKAAMMGMTLRMIVRESSTQDTTERKK